MRKSESGQVLLIVLLAMVTVTTLVLSVVTRSVTDVAVTTNQDQALRAFTAAESGVERALVGSIAPEPNPLLPPAEITGDLGLEATDVEANFTATVTTFPADPTEYFYPFEVSAGDVATLWLTDHNPDNQRDDSCPSGNCFDGSSILLCWADVSNWNSVDAPAVEITLVYEDPITNTIHSAREAIDNNTGRSGNNFDSPNGGGGACGFTTPSGTVTPKLKHLVDINALTGGRADIWGNAGNLKFLQVRMLYNINLPAQIGFKVAGGGSPTFPGQGKLIDSVGESGTSSRRVEVFSLYPEPPAVFSSAVFSGTSITK